MTTIDSIRNIINQQIKPIADTAPSNSTTAVQPEGKSSFSSMLGNAIKEVDALQKNANNQIEGITLGGEDANTHTAMIALEKADVAFQLMSAVRTKIIRAYEEVMRTPV